MQLLLGCIADDITGASDLALMLENHGMPTRLYLGLPGADAVIDTPAVVVGLKIRTAAAKQAVKAVREAGSWCQGRGAETLFYKYCSTFDSTADGNIGPACDALLNLTGADLTIIAPSFPDNGRTVEQGILYVNGVPLGESSMRHHPLTPMTESSLLTLMDAQTGEGQTGLINLDTVRNGAEAIRVALDEQRRSARRYVVIDAASNNDFDAIVAATDDMPLLTGGSAVASAIPESMRRHGHLTALRSDDRLPQSNGYVAVIAGSCSKATLTQIEDFKAQTISIPLQPGLLFDQPDYLAESIERATQAQACGHVLVYASAPHDALHATQTRYGVTRSANVVEAALADIARALRNAGTRRFIVAGGETSAAVADGLSLKSFRIGPQIDPGVPWLYTTGDDGVWIALKSGNFGSVDFFSKAIGMLR